MLLGDLASSLYLMNLARRTRVVFSGAEWSETLKLNPVRKDWYPDLLELPELLGKVDSKLRDPDSDLSDVCAELVSKPASDWRSGGF